MTQTDGVQPWWLAEPDLPREVVYISGPMTGIGDFNRPAFERARKHAERKGYSVIVPGDGEVYNENELATLTVEPEHRQEWLRLDVESILLADKVWVLDGWEKSRGSTFEVLIALELGIPVFTEDDGLVRRDEIAWWATSAPWGDRSVWTSPWTKSQTQNKTFVEGEW